MRGAYCRQSGLACCAGNVITGITDHRVAKADDLAIALDMINTIMWSLPLASLTCKLIKVHFI